MVSASYIDPLYSLAMMLNDAVSTGQTKFLIMSVKPKLSQLALVLNDLTWCEVRAMAVQLEMDYSKLEQIQQQKTELSDRLLCSMDSWLKSDPNASWAKIVRALEAISKNVLASELEQKYCQPPTTTATLTQPPTNPSPIASSDIHVLPPSPASSAPLSPPFSESSLPLSPPSPHLTSECSLSHHPPPPLSDSINTVSPPAFTSATLSSSPRPTPDPRPCRHIRRTSPPPTISRSTPTPSPQPPQLSPLTTTQPQQLPGWRPRAVKPKEEKVADQASQLQTNESKEERIRRVAEEASSFQEHFVTVLTHTQIYLSKREAACSDFLNGLCITLINLPLSTKFKHLLFLRTKRRQIEDAQSVSKVFEILEDLWNYTDYALLQRIVQEFADHEIREEMKVYTAELEEFEKRTTVKDFEDATGEKNTPYDYSEAIFEVRTDPSQCTLYQMRQIVMSLAHKSSLQCYAPLVKGTRSNSVLITLAFPRDAIELLVPALDRRFLSTHNISSVTIDEKPLQTYSKEYLMVYYILHRYVCGCRPISRPRPPMRARAYPI